MPDQAPTAAGPRVLYQFPISHYCEKVRWHLDIKRLPYRVHNLLPGFHRSRLTPLGATTTVPVLRDGDVAVGDSLRISEHVEARYAHRPLLPSPGPDRTRCLRLERFFSEEVGPSVRLWLFGLLLREGAGAIRRAFFRGYRPLPRLLGGSYSLLLKREIRRLYDIDEGTMAQARERAEAGLGALERELDGEYLVGPRFTLADLAAAAIFGPLVAAPESPWAGQRLSPALSSLVEATRRRPAGQWVLARYRRDRWTADEGMT